MIWGSVGLTKVRWKQNLLVKLNSNKYIEVIDEQINTREIRIPGNKCIFQRDNAVK